MREACSLVWSVLVLLFRSRASLEAEILTLRHQLNIQRRHLPKRLTFGAIDRLIFVGLYRLVPSTLNALTIVKPETVVRWHRAGFRSYWRWKSRHRGGRPTVPLEIGELLKLGMNSWRSPQWIGDAHLADQLAYFQRHRRPAAAMPRFPATIQSDPKY